ncbi:Holliday junction ATP-dependent DNA helicase RuvA [compost metagenome]
MILSSNTPDEIQSAIVNGQVALIQKIKGIGPKTAQRLILELQDKLKKQGVETLSTTIQSQSIPDEALSALVMLGFNKVAAEKVLNTILKTESNLSVEDMIKLALKRL